VTIGAATIGATTGGAPVVVVVQLASMVAASNATASLRIRS
jgi:hypothetical protein